MSSYTIEDLLEQESRDSDGALCQAAHDLEVERQKNADLESENARLQTMLHTSDKLFWSMEKKRNEAEESYRTAHDAFEESIKNFNQLNTFFEQMHAKWQAEVQNTKCLEREIADLKRQLSDGAIDAAEIVVPNECIFCEMTDGDLLPYAFGGHYHTECLKGDLLQDFLMLERAS